ncbi:TonB-dependent receptor [soil metagenome]
MKRALVVFLLASATATAAYAAEEQGQDVAELVVVSPTTGAGGVERDKLGYTVETLKGEDFREASALSVTEGLNRRFAGINVSDTQGNPFAGDISFHGFTASALQGTPQGIAVYVNGDRLNEAFGDTVNWDLIPQVAISRADIFTNNPTYGLNAIGGAIAIRMKDGFNGQGLRASGEGGSFGFRSGSIDGGIGNDRYGLYLALDGGQDDGWRQLSDSKVWRGYGDLGFKVGTGEFHLIGGQSSSTLGVVGPTPVDLLDADRTSVYTFPQTTENDAKMAALNGAFTLAEGITLQGGLHYRHFDQAHVDGNDGDFERCSGNAANPLFNTLCLDDNAFPTNLAPPKASFQLRTPNGAVIACPAPGSAACNSTPYGTLDRSWTTTTTRGASIQLASKRELFGRKNAITVGAAVDDSGIHFRSNSTLAIILPSLEVNESVAGVPGVGQVIRATGAVGYGPADLSATNRQTGAYVTDTLDLTDRLFLTVGGRYNRSQIDTQDLTGINPDLTGNHNFTRFNPAVSLSFIASPGLTLFGGYSEANRAPTPLELGCSDPLKPCLLENSLVADPPLKQVVARSFEGGARGRLDGKDGRISWSLSAYNTKNSDDIISLASALAGRGYFTNVPGTRRSGLDAQIDYTGANWSVFAGYSYIKAIYLFDGLVASPNNPAADANGDIAIEKGDRLAGIPRRRLKFGFDVELTKSLSLGVDTARVGEQFLVGDEGNDNEKLPAYWVSNLNAAYRFGEGFSLFARVDNLFDHDYATFGTYFDPDGVSRVVPAPLPPNADEQSLTPAAPRRISVGLRVKF